MGKARSLFLALAGATSLTVACVIPWQDSANLHVFPLQDDASITPTGDTGADAIEVSAQAGGSRASRRPDGEEPAPPPELAMLAPRTALGSPQKDMSLPADRLPLAQQLQRELARVGCYEGDLNGVWTPTVRKTMKAFMDRVNATLPTDEPDYILLALVQGARDRVCGATCPPGEGLAEGRCMSNAILAVKKTPQLIGSSAPKSPAVADARPAAGLNAPGPAQAGAAMPGPQRPADAKRAAARPATFGQLIFKPFEKLGF